MPDEVSFSDAARVVSKYKSRSTTLKRFYDYYDGQHYVGDWATKKFREKYGWALSAATTNYCPAVVSGFTDGITVVGLKSGNKLPEDLLNNIQREVARATLDAWLTGDGFLMVERNASRNDLMVIYQKADSIVPNVSSKDPSVLESVGRVYFDGIRWHMEIIYSDRTVFYEGLQEQEYFAHGGAKKSPVLSHKPEDWGPPRVEAHEFGCVPVIWLKREAVSQFSSGRSIIADVIPVQDRLNKFAADSIVGSEGVVSPIRYFLDDEDNIGNAVEAAAMRNGSVPNPYSNAFENAAGAIDYAMMERMRANFDDSRKSIIYTTAKSAGQFDAPDVTAMIALETQAQKHIASMVGLPPWFMSGSAPDNVSAETALILSDRVLRKQKAFVRDNRAALNGLLELLGYEGESLIFEFEDPNAPDVVEERPVDTDII